ncbi:MAG: hypothetical protein GY784_10600, partial [Gammaproteobacteria bacterium]|nr:hypothetical protein [Gammaproteobacteria bacterium]
MLNPDNLSIVSQMPGQHEFVEGIYEAPTYIVGIDKALGLMAISSSTSSLDTSPAKLAMDVLMDDMRTNIPMLAKAKTESKVAAMAVNCLQESLSNINEYLCSQ